MSTNRVASAYVIDKKASQVWICTARYNCQDLTANYGDCVKLPTDIGRPLLNEAYNVRPVTGSAAISAFFPYSGSSIPQAVRFSFALYAMRDYACE
jgi:hypothetical protein